MNLKHTPRVAIAVLLLSAFCYADVVNFPGGRIAFSSDGNQHDKDDYGATALACALVDAAGLNDKVVHYDFADHLGNNNATMEAEMIESAIGGAERFSLDKSRVFNDQRQLSAAIENFRIEANKSSANNPLWYICAGPMEVAWRCCNAVDADKRRFITCISHSNWNNNHDDTAQMSHTWSDLPALGVNRIKITDQNSSNGDDDFNTPENKWYWLRDSSDPDWRWLYSRDKKNGFDVSDAGMTYWLITGGPNGGNEIGGWQEAKYLLENPVVGDSTPPTPSQAQWDQVPVALDDSSVMMSAAAGFDAQSPPVEYYFRELSGNCHSADSGWQSSRTFTAMGLAPGTEYTFALRMRDQAHNENFESAPRSVMTTGVQDTTPPTPDIPTFEMLPKALSSSRITMTAAAGTDAHGPVEYYFQETSGNAGGNDSGWQTQRSYTDSGLSGGTEYTYRIMMRDAACNETFYSDGASAITPLPQIVELGFDPIDDAFVQGTAGFNTAKLKVEANYRVSYLKFEVTGVPVNYETTSVEIVLTENGDTGNGTLRFYRASDNEWSEETINSSNAPSTADEVGSRSGSVGGGQTITVDVTPLVAGDGIYTVIIKMDAGGNDIWFGSKESGKVPKLNITAELSAPLSTDIDGDGRVNLVDAGIVAANWMRPDCLDNDYCSGADIDVSGRVDYGDLLLIAYDWLSGVELPVH